jgi:beta-lactamase class D
MKKGIVLTFLCLLSYATFSQTIVEKDFSKYFNKHGVNGCFALYNPNTKEYINYNSARCDSGFIPASTFKIPNSLIALEEGIIKDTNQVIKWDGHEWPNKLWNQDQTIKTAIKYSCVWAYEGLAEQIGNDTYMKYLKAFGYGNLDLSGPPTRFWLEGPFRISANQQVVFLKKLYYNELGVSKQSTDIVKSIIIRETGSNYVLRGKTGSGVISDNNIVYWYVGYIEKDNVPHFYALNINGTEADKTKYYIRNNILNDIFKELEIME